MKKVLLTLVVLMLAISLVGCGSSYGKIKAAFEEKGYTELEVEETDNFKKMQEEMKEEGIEFTVHHLQKVQGIAPLEVKTDVYVLEFKNVDGIKELVQGENDIAETMKWLLEEADTSYEEIYAGLEDAGFVNGNCMFIAGDITALGAISIFKDAK